MFHGQRHADTYLFIKALDKLKQQDHPNETVTSREAISMTYVLTSTFGNYMPQRFHVFLNVKQAVE